jgi:hypothetical protein
LDYRVKKMIAPLEQAIFGLKQSLADARGTRAEDHKENGARVAPRAAVVAVPPAPTLWPAPIDNP